MRERIGHGAQPLSRPWGSGRPWVKASTRVMILAFLGFNLFFRVLTLFDYSPFVAGLILFVALFSLAVVLFPGALRAFLFLFGLSFFLFGFRGYDIQSQVFDTVVPFVALTVFLVNRRGKDGKEPNRTLAGFLLCYAALSLFSLLLLPMGHIVKDFWLFGLRPSLLLVAGATPNTHLYPLAGVNRLILYLTFAWVMAGSRGARDLFRWLFVGIFSGAVFASFIGLLDYYGAISLAWYRFGRVVTPGALHSTFLNRGWFAEFVLTVVPFVLIGFMRRTGGRRWKVLLLACLVVCEIALILAGARAGWVAYPLILFVCWLFFYFAQEGRLDTFNFRWRDLVKVAVSVPVTILLSFFLIFEVLMPLSDSLHDKSGGKSKAPASEATVKYLKSRASRLIEPKGRVPAWMQGVDVARESPVFGMGYESFCRHAQILSRIPDSPYSVNKANKFKRVLDTPHSIYCQLLVSGGIVGLMIWLATMGYSLILLVMDLIRNKRLLNVPVIISIISFHIYGLFQSMQYIPVIWMLIFLNLGYAMTVGQGVLPAGIRRMTVVGLKALAVLVIIGGGVYLAGRGSQALADRYGMKVYALDQDWHDYHGFYWKERWGKKLYRWSGRRGTVVVRSRGEEAVGFELQCHTPGVERSPVRVDVYMDGDWIDEIVFRRKGGVERWYGLGGHKGPHEFEFQVSRTWNPRRWGFNDDRRDLGIAVGGPLLIKEMADHLP